MKNAKNWTKNKAEEKQNGLYILETISVIVIFRENFICKKVPNMDKYESTVQHVKGLYHLLVVGFYLSVIIMSHTQ